MADQIDVKLVKDIKIKSGVVKRLAKEKVSYEKESQKMQEKLAKMKSENPDDYMIKKQQELLDESKGMVPDCQRRLTVAWDELQKLVDESVGLSDTEEFKAAQIILGETKEATGRK